MATLKTYRTEKDIENLLKELFVEERGLACVKNFDRFKSTTMTPLEWIKTHYPTSESARLQCAEATLALTQAFPYLRRVRGHAMVEIHLRPHWWCLTETGDILDPTAHQWPNPPTFYELLPDNFEEPHGKCLECGELLFRYRGAQSFHCENCL